jgi:hypothetical protein
MSNSLQFGANGSILKAEGSLSAGDYVVICALTDSVVTAVTNWVGADSPETLTLSAGQTVYGVFSTITWVSGSIVAYE